LAAFGKKLNVLCDEGAVVVGCGVFGWEDVSVRMFVLTSLVVWVVDCVVGVGDCDVVCVVISVVVSGVVCAIGCGVVSDRNSVTRGVATLCIVDVVT